MQAQQEDNRQQPQRNKQIIFIIVVYLTLTLLSRLTTQTSSFNKSVISQINNQGNVSIPVNILMGLFQTEKYIGTWNSSDPKTLNFLSRGEGTCHIALREISNKDTKDYEFQFTLNNGIYRDDGSIYLRFILTSDKIQSVKQDRTSIIKFKQISSLNQSTLSQANKTQSIFTHEKVLKTLQQKNMQINSFKLNITAHKQSSNLDISFNIESTGELKFDVSLQKQQSLMFSTIVFAILLFFISYTEFSAVMQMLRSIFQGMESASNYSVITFLAATMWDAALCVIAFMEAFSNQESLILFIMPAFLLCLLFTNLELRILLLIFQSRSQTRNIRQVVCKFNIFTYGSLMLMYPVLVYTNLSSLFFIVISLILMPQIYANALKGQRPNIQSAYYSKFLTFRFLLILYLKCFPWNIFQLQPNYLLGFTCVALLAFQLFLLWVQKKYGPKKVLPKFLLPPVFNYGCEEINVQQGAESIECAICLANLESQPEVSNTTLNIPFRIMKGPCGHKFHGACLGQWMQIKMQCPQCRRPLPPFQ